MYEKLLKEVEKEDIEVLERKLSKRIKGLCCDNVIFINESLTTNTEKPSWTVRKLKSKMKKYNQKVMKLLKIDIKISKTLLHK